MLKRAPLTNMVEESPGIRSGMTSQSGTVRPWAHSQRAGRCHTPDDCAVAATFLQGATGSAAQELVEAAGRAQGDVQPDTQAGGRATKGAAP